MRVALIDGDTTVYSTTTATEKAIKWDDDLWTLHGFESEAIAHFDDEIATIRAAVDADDVIIALSCADPQRWREDIMPTYKGNRKEKRKPLLYGAIREHCHRTHKTMERPKLEGDDILGIMATHPNLNMLKGATSRVVVSIDKDLKTIPGEHYNYQKKVSFTVNAFEANYWHLYQSVMGDTTDGYPGCPGIGPKSAAALLEPFIEYDEAEGEAVNFHDISAWKAIVAAYQKKGLSEEVALLNARVARICRYTDYDLNKKEVVLWNPPK